MAKKSAAKKKASVKKKPSPKKTAPKKAVTKKAAAKKTVAKKANPSPSKPTAKKATKPVRKAAKSAKKAGKNSAPVKKAAARKKSAAKKAAPAKKAVIPKKKPVSKKTSPAGKAATGKKKVVTEKTSKKKPVRKAVPAKEKKGGEKPARERKIRADWIGQLQGKPNDKTVSGDAQASSRPGPGVFTLEDVREILSQAPLEDAGMVKPVAKKAVKKAKETRAKTPAKTPVKKAPEELPSRPPQSFGAVSMADILGFDPLADSREQLKSEEAAIPKKFLPYYRQLIKMRETVSDQIDRHSEESRILSKSRDSETGNYRESSNDTDPETFDIDFALSLVSSEQEAIFEINEAIDRMKAGTYGKCEITGKPISKQRLKAVPFTRYSLEGQQEVEGNRRRSVSRSVGVFSTTAEDVAAFADSDDE